MKPRNAETRRAKVLLPLLAPPVLCLTPCPPPLPSTLLLLSVPALCLLSALCPAAPLCYRPRPSRFPSEEKKGTLLEQESLPSLAVLLSLLPSLDPSHPSAAFRCASTAEQSPPFVPAFWFSNVRVVSTAAIPAAAR